MDQLDLAHTSYIMARDKMKKECLFLSNNVNISKECEIVFVDSDKDINWPKWDVAYIF